jgi:hypothetical protein
LLEAELFGNDATSKPGMLEAADGGAAATRQGQPGDTAGAVWK